MVRVRFAPSPTGDFHVGLARTALFNWLFARHHGGEFILRIEDTDRERSTEESIAQIVDALRWLGLDWDECHRQTDRYPEHLRAAESLMERGYIYESDGAWWFRVPEQGETVVHDELLGDVVFSNDQLKDFVIRRSDGSFIYHFVVVVDDADMGITHVIRGDEHLNNTPKHVLLFQALGREVPRFAHLPLILGPDRAKLSKRHGAASLFEYRDRGFLPETMVNFLARLGWSHADQEVFTIDELIEHFSLDAVGSSGRVTEEMWDRIGRDRLIRGADLLRDRSHTLEDLAWAMEILFPVPLEPVDEIEVTERQAELMEGIADSLKRLEPFTPAEIERTIRAYLASQGAKLKDVALACRIAVTGRKAGPGLFQVLAPIGSETVSERLRSYPKGKKG